MDFTTLIPQFGGVLWTLVAFVVALSVIVFIHELGHYLVGRWSGIKADVFSLGFGPVLFSRMDRHGTRWQFAALPFGGYVKFRGDADAASGKDVDAMQGLSAEDARHTMHGAPLWARAATVAAGPVFNFVLSILLFGALIWGQGQARDPLTIGEFTPLPIAHELQVGDELIAVGDMALPNLENPDAGAAIRAELEPAETVPYDIRRNGRDMRVEGPYPFLPLIQRVSPQSAAWNIELMPGDVILSVDGENIYAFEELRQRVEASDGAPLELRVWRATEEAGEEILDFTLAPRRVDEPLPEGGFQTQWRIGIIGGFFFEPATEPTGFTDALTGGVAQTWRIMEASVSGLYHMVTGAISSCNLSGPIGIAQTSGAMASQGTVSFLWFIALLSAAVGFLNLFPIPVLDGGHLVFYAWEAVTGNPPSDKALKILMTIGLACVLTLMVFALGNDLFCP